jgi:adenosylcobyric acid synthase
VNSEVRAKAFAAYDRLAASYNFIVMEGAGSPAEINLLERDFVNMAMAEHAGASVILVADIDRGGVFASIYGTFKLLPEKWRKLFKGIIINKFRGDETLLESGISRIENMLGTKVLGVVPYLKNLKVEEEDSLAFDAPSRSRGKMKDDSLIDIAVVKLPRISNFTDFLVFERRGDCAVRYFDDVGNFGEPDIVFLPGTKNTRADLEFLKVSGIADAIIRYRERKKPIFGICGGYQMLGTEVNDDLGVEDEPGSSRGLCLLDIKTEMKKEKKLLQVSGKTAKKFSFLQKKGVSFSGYEIHMGESISENAEYPLAILDKNGKELNREGAVSKDGLVFGTYVHGFFDSAKIANALISWLKKQKGTKTTDKAGRRPNRDSSFETFCEIVKKKVKIDLTSPI